MPYAAKNLRQGRRIEGGAIRRDAQQCQGACRQGRFEPPEKRPDVLVGGIVIQDLVEEALVAAMIDGREYAAGAVIELIGSHIPRKISQGPVQEGGVHARLRLFSPPPRPRSGWWHRGQRRGGRARGANARAGRAGHLRPPAVPPDPSRGGCTERRGAPDPRGPRASTCDTSYSSAANRSRRDRVDTRGRDGPNRATSAGTACLYRPGAHTADTLGACRCDWQGRFLVGASRQSRSSLRWDRVDTHPDRPWLCPP